MVETDNRVKAAITSRLDNLSGVDLDKVLHFVETVAEMPRGMTGGEFAALPRTLTPEEAMEMMQIIEEGCEQVDEDAW